ncbi:hypothetical protein BG011_002676 [Mortierella polycephala]|uniref:RWD domain-containing protein n=1 Tax=Mortierella polycephala TaxID=41804 RepID=A0A9P6U4I5_9FUNG|nr:hypothetical protein BG011_002676 [Mortierella polycephala]
MEKTQEHNNSEHGNSGQSDDKSSNGDSMKLNEPAVDKEPRFAGPKPLPRLSTSLGGPFIINDHGPASVIQKMPTYNNGVGSSFVDTMTQQLSIHVEQPVGSMSISPSSRDVVLAARKGLYIIDLENPYEPPRVLHHLTKWEVADVQWNPHFSRENWIASTSNQKALIWNLAHNAPRAVELILHAHNRAISDINWSPFHPDLLATCSVDTFVHLWDLRTPKKPVNSFCAWTAAATVVKFNRKDEFTLASAHDTKVEVWDTRKGSSPFISIQAHKQKINGIDWSRKHRNHIVTCSLDKMIKFWDIDDPSKPNNEITTKSPVWRARHTPFGHGILTMPQRTETALSLWNRDNSSEPVCRFEGHKDTVKEFVWRVRNTGDDSDKTLFQLVTWSKDQHLRLWPINEKMLEAMDHKATTPIETQPYPPTHDNMSFRDPPPLNMTATPSRAVSTLRILAGNRLSTMSPFRTSMSSRTVGPLGNHGGYYRERKAPSPLVWMQGVRMVKPSGDLGLPDRASPLTVATEIAAVGQKFQNVKFEKVNVAGRTCTISLNSLRSNEGVSFLRLNITFPQFYPKQAPPTFEIQKSGMLSMATRAQIVANLDHIAATHASRGLPCLEAIIRCLLGEDRRDENLEKGLDDSDEDDTVVNPLRRSRGRDNAVDKKDQQIPFPCLCGAVFATNGVLVTFFSKLRTPHASSSSMPVAGRSSTLIKSPYTYTHPRTYASIGEYKAFSRLPSGSEGLAGTVSSFVEDADDQDDLWPMPNLFSKTKPKHELVRVTRKPKDQPVYFKPVPQSRSTLYLKDITHLLPASPRLAAVYTLNGENVSEVCEQNALQARHLGRMDLYKIWKLAALILTLSVPMDPVAFEMHRVELSKMNAQTNPDRLLDLVYRANHAKQRRDSGMAFVPLLEDTFYQKVKWGTHPLGRKLVDVLFSYLERHGDIQTLALLSCVFKDPFRNTISVSGMTPPQAQYRPRESPMSDAPDYFNMRQAGNTRTLSGVPLNTTPISMEQSSARPRTPAATKISPYLNRVSPTTTAFGTSYSSSMRRAPNRFNAGGVTSPLTTPSSLREVYSDSNTGYGTSNNGPPAVMPNNAYAMYGNASQEASVQPYTHNKRDSINSIQGSSPTLFSRLSPMHRRESSSSPSSVMDKNERNTVRANGFKMTKMNTGMFDSDDTPMNIPLLDPAKETQHNTWRLLYAEMMYSWGLFEARTELLKFLTFKRSINYRVKEEQSPLEKLLGIEKRGPQIFNKCFECEYRLYPSYKCDFCKRMRLGIKCTICHISVRGRTSVCLKCAHGGHTQHLWEWFVQEKNQDCPTGCGCECQVNFGGWAGGMAIQPIYRPSPQQESSL